MALLTTDDRDHIRREVEAVACRCEHLDAELAEMGRERSRDQAELVRCRSLLRAHGIDPG